MVWLLLHFTIPDEISCSPKHCCNSIAKSIRFCTKILVILFQMPLSTPPLAHKGYASHRKQITKARNVCCKLFRKALILGSLMWSHVPIILLKVFILSKFINQNLQPWKKLAFVRTTLVRSFGISLLQLFYMIFSPVKTDPSSFNNFYFSAFCRI